jgi:hypothetical protein
MLVCGCVHEQVAWPLTREDIRRINAGVDAQRGGLRVEYVESLATDAGAHVDAPTAIASVDADRIAFQMRDESVRTIPIAMVKSVSVQESGTGALIGAGIGLAGGVAVLAAGHVLAQSDPRDASYWAGGTRSPYTALEFLIWPVAVGAVVGYVFGSRRTFEFGGGR